MWDNKIKSKEKASQGWKAPCVLPKGDLVRFTQSPAFRKLLSFYFLMG